MKNRYRILAGFCIVCYTCLVMLFSYIYTQSKLAETTEIEIVEEPVIVTVEVEEPKAEPTYSKTFIDQLIHIRKVNNDNISIAEAMELIGKIAFYADKYNITLEDALTLVQVESDFDINAYVKWSGAVSLCQVTPICVEEYNRVNETTYTIEDMWNIDNNLDVGFWYFARLMDNDIYGESHHIEDIRDAYMAYNIGPNGYKNNYNTYRSGLNLKGETYRPIVRFDTIASNWNSI